MVVLKTPEYTHKQTAPLCLILYGSAVGCFILGWWIGVVPGTYVATGVGLLLTLLAPVFHHLTVADHGDGLAIQFGPAPLFRRRVSYIDIEKVEVGRTLVVDGWGIHSSIRGGWVWNLWGRDCIVVYFKTGAVQWIGTDDAENRTAFLRSIVSA